MITQHDKLHAELQTVE